MCCRVSKSPFTSVDHTQHAAKGGSCARGPRPEELQFSLALQFIPFAKVLDSVMTKAPSSAASLSDTPILTRGRHFTDDQHRVISLRGFNVSAASKLPTSPDGLTRLDAETWFDHRNVSFVGRPFELSEAPHHFKRILEWGYPFVRLLVTWEALSHRGPGLADVDREYIAYVKQLVEIAGDLGLKVVVSSHQDVWSRLCGGSGAPGWTLEDAGFDLRAFHDTKAAYVHNLDDGKSATDKREISGPFVWPSGYQKLAAATMATLFWAGSIFAWKCKRVLPNDFGSEGEVQVSIQEYLQSSFINAFGMLADAIGDCDAILGFEVFNEPHRGFVELHGWDKWCYETDLHIGHYPSMLQSLALGSGYAQNVPYYVKSWPFPTKVSHYSRVDPKGKSVWSDGGECIWRSHGAWEWNEKSGKASAPRPDFFTSDPRPGSATEGSRIEWYRDCYAPFLARFADRMRRKHAGLQLWFEPIPNEFQPPWPSPEVLSALNDDQREALREAALNQRYAAQTHIQTARPSNIVFAPHFYDLNVLFAKLYKGMSVNVQGLSRGMFILKALYFGEEGLKKNYTHQLTNLVSYARSSLGELPIVVGEIGIPFDVNEGRALQSGDYTVQSQLLDALAHGMEQSKVSGWSWWNYNPHNTIENGDYWNQEDFSVVCSDSAAADRNLRPQFEQDDLYKDARCLDAIIRPYASRIAGVPVESKWDRYAIEFTLKYAESLRFQELTKTAEDGDESSPPTVIYLPRYHFQGRKLDVQVSDGHYELDLQRQIFIHTPSVRRPGTTHTIRIRALDSPYKRSALGALTFQQRAIIVVTVVVGITAILAMDRAFKQAISGR